MADSIEQLMVRFVGLTVDGGRALYATLSPEDQAALDDRGLKRMWRSMRASEAHARRKRNSIAEFDAAMARGERPPMKLNKAAQKALEDAKARACPQDEGGDA